MHVQPHHTRPVYSVMGITDDLIIKLVILISLILIVCSLSGSYSLAPMFFLFVLCFFFLQTYQRSTQRHDIKPIFCSDAKLCARVFGQLHLASGLHPERFTTDPLLCRATANYDICQTQALRRCCGDKSAHDNTQLVETG